MNAKHYLYPTWSNMYGRCHNPRRHDFERYGGRGISVYKEWRRKGRGCPGFNSFLSWILTNLGERPEGMTLDRIDNDKDYEPGNLRWATSSEQVRNRRPVGGHQKPSMQKKLPWCTKTKSGRYQSQFMFKKVFYRAGLFDTEAEASAASAALRATLL
jgi:hypothetical protein